AVSYLITLNLPGKFSAGSPSDICKRKLWPVLADLPNECRFCAVGVKAGPIPVKSAVVLRIGFQTRAFRDAATIIIEFVNDVSEAGDRGGRIRRPLAKSPNIFRLPGSVSGFAPGDFILYPVKTILLQRLLGIGCRLNE